MRQRNSEIKRDNHQLNIWSGLRYETAHQQRSICDQIGSHAEADLFVAMTYMGDSPLPWSDMAAGMLTLTSSAAP